MNGKKRKGGERKKERQKDNGREREKERRREREGESERGRASSPISAAMHDDSKQIKSCLEFNSCLLYLIDQLFSMDEAQIIFAK